MIKIIVNEKQEKENKAIINIVVVDNSVSVNADNVEYRDMLKALEGLTFATTKAGINDSETPLDVFNVVKDITEVMVDGRDSAFEENN